MKLISSRVVSAALLFNCLCSGDFANRFSNRINESNTDEIANVVGEDWTLQTWEEYVLPSRVKREPNITAEIEILKQNGTENATLSAELEKAKQKRELFEQFERQWPVQRWRDIGLFTDDYLNIINEHWLRFPPPSETLQKMLGGFYLLFSTLGCWGNVIVLFMYCK